MLKARVIKPNSRAKGVLPSKGLPSSSVIFKCAACENANYSRKDYKILYENKKLCYFKIPLTKAEDILLCHDCFTKRLSLLLEASKAPVLDILIMEGKEKFIMTINYEDGDTSDFSPF